MLPIILHVKEQPSTFERKGPCVLILTPHQPIKDDIYSITKEYLDEAQVSCTSLYESEETESQVEKLKSSSD